VPVPAPHAGRIAYVRAFIISLADRGIDRLVFMPSSVLPPVFPKGPTEEGVLTAALGSFFHDARESHRRYRGLVRDFFNMSAGKNFDAAQGAKASASGSDPRQPAGHGYSYAALWGLEAPGCADRPRS
jgi:hypothetical protein